MKKYKLSLIIMLYSITILAQNEKVVEKIKTSAFSIGETVEIKSLILEENRILNIYLPLGYTKETSKKYPVIYLLDGSKDEDFIHIAGLVQFGTFPWLKILPESIVVGIANIDRKRDFTFPTNNKKDKKQFPTTGGSKKFIEFIEKELQPFVDKNYRTENIKTVLGQSLGGLLATEILFKKPELFDNFIIVSPSLWWDDESLLENKADVLSSSFSQNKRIYIAVGKEGKVMERTAKELADKLKKGNKEKVISHFEYFGGQNHANILHIAAYNAFEKIFKKEEESK